MLNAQKNSQNIKKKKKTLLIYVLYNGRASVFLQKYHIKKEKKK